MADRHTNNAPHSLGQMVDEIMKSLRSSRLAADPHLMPYTPRMFGPSGSRAERTLPGPTFEIIENPVLVVTTEDWSRVRSPGRARRRRGKHRQNIVITGRPSTEIYVVGDMIVCHPETAKAVRDRFQRKMEEVTDRAFFGILRGSNV